MIRLKFQGRNFPRNVPRSLSVRDLIELHGINWVDEGGDPVAASLIYCTSLDLLCVAITMACSKLQSCNSSTRQSMSLSLSLSCCPLVLKQATAVRVLDLACPVFCGAAVTVPGYLDALVRHR